MSNFSFMGAYADLTPEQQAEADKRKLAYYQTIRRRETIKAAKEAAGAGSSEVKATQDAIFAQEAEEKANLQPGFASPEEAAAQKSLLIPILAVVGTGIGAYLIFKG